MGAMNIMDQATELHFAVCIRNDEAKDLEPRKIYQVLPDEVASAVSYLWVIDESGEDYLYPREYFIAIELPAPLKQALLATG